MIDQPVDCKALPNIKDAEEHFFDSSKRYLQLVNQSIKLFGAMIKINTNSIILYYAALVSNIGVKFRNIGD